MPDGFTSFRLGLLAEDFEDPLQSLDLPSGLALMLDERASDPDCAALAIFGSVCESCFPRNRHP
jgi:hypothetical protein